MRALNIAVIMILGLCITCPNVMSSEKSGPQGKMAKSANPPSKVTMQQKNLMQEQYRKMGWLRTKPVTTPNSNVSAGQDRKRPEYSAEDRALMDRLERTNQIFLTIVKRPGDQNFDRLVHWRDSAINYCQNTRPENDVTNYWGTQMCKDMIQNYEQALVAFQAGKPVKDPAK